MASSTVRVLCVGDVVGIPGRSLFQKHVPALKRKYSLSAIIVNGENSSDRGRGITPRIVSFFKHNGADVITSGNHIWAAREIYEYLANNNDLLRPANFPSGAPGVGVTIFTIDRTISVGVINLQGRTFMREYVDCPLKAADSLLTYLKDKTSVIFVDFHAETTSEKAALGIYLDGRVSAVFGTHTHVQTADERILPRGTAFITDLGMVGSLNGTLGMKSGPVISNMLTQMPAKFEVDTQGPFQLCGIIVDVDQVSGKAVAIERVRIIDTELVVDSDL